MLKLFFFIFTGLNIVNVSAQSDVYKCESKELNLSFFIEDLNLKNLTEGRIFVVREHLFSSTNYTLIDFTQTRFSTSITLVSGRDQLSIHPRSINVIWEGTSVTNNVEIEYTSGMKGFVSTDALCRRF